MTSKRAVRLLRSVALLALTGLMVSGCVIRDPQAITDLNQAQKAIASAKEAGAADRFPDEFAELEKRHLEARGVFYACQDAKASDLARQLMADANALATKRVEAPKPMAPPPPPNKPPVARLVGPSDGEIKVLMKFDASGSSDPDGDKLTYKWDFGDGTMSSYTWPIATHRYSTVGNYTVRVTVDDGRGGSASATNALSIVKRVVLQDSEGLVYFDFDRATLKPEAKKVLGGVVQDMKANPKWRAEIVGHTDWTGSPKYNMDLSRRRAEAAKKFIVDGGVPGDHIKTDWKGESQPIASNKIKAGRAKNRRVVITLRRSMMQ